MTNEELRKRSFCNYKTPILISLRIFYQFLIRNLKFVIKRQRLNQDIANLFSETGNVIIDDDCLKIVCLTREQILTLKLLSDRERDWHDAEYMIQSSVNSDKLKNDVETLTNAFPDSEKRIIKSMYEELSKKINS